MINEIADKDEVIAAIRRLSGSLRLSRYCGLLDRYDLLSFSAKCLGMMPLARLRELLRDIGEQLGFDDALNGRR